MFGMVVALVACKKYQVGIQVFQVLHITLPIATIAVAAAGKTCQHNFLLVDRVFSYQSLVHGLFPVP